MPSTKTSIVPNNTAIRHRLIFCAFPLMFIFFQAPGNAANISKLSRQFFMAEIPHPDGVSRSRNAQKWRNCLHSSCTAKYKLFISR